MFSFILIHVITFLGLVLCCTHLSDVTLSIASNILHTFFFYFKGKVYWFIFTDKNLNSDTLVRLAYLHYITAFYLVFLAFTHSIDMHFDWKYETTCSGIDQELVWFDEALANEIGSICDLYLSLFFAFWSLYSSPEALTYEIFMWGDIGLVNDVRFYGIAPHWYFRPFMAWLTVCPMHVTGIFGIIFYFFSLYHQPSLRSPRPHNVIKRRVFTGSNKGAYEYVLTIVPVEHYFTQYVLFYIFIMCLLYSTSFLPSGRYYQRVHGNNGMLFSFFYTLWYVTYGSGRRFKLVDLWILNFKSRRADSRGDIKLHVTEYVYQDAIYGYADKEFLEAIRNNPYQK